MAESAAFLEKAEEQYQISGRWLYYAVLVLASLQFIIVGPYINLTHQKELLTHQIESQRRLLAEAHVVSDKLTRQQASIRKELQARTDAVVSDLKCRFRQLDSLINADSPSDQAGSTHAAAASAPPFVQSFVQRPAPGAMQTPYTVAVECARASPLPAMQNQDRGDARDAERQGDRAKLLATVRSYVNDNIIRPRLVRFNDDWQRDVASVIDLQIADTKAAIAAEQAQLIPNTEPVGAAEIWQSLAKAADGMAQVVRQVRLTDDPGTDWWGTSEEKGRRMALQVKEAMRVASDPPRAVADAFRTLESQMGTQNEQLHAVEQDMNAKEAEMKDLRESLASFVLPAKLFATDLYSLSGQFTLLLGSALAVAIAWSATRLAELIDAAEASVLTGSSDTAAFAWLAIRARRWPYRASAMAVSRCILFGGWIGFTAWQWTGPVSSLSRWWQPVVATLAVCAASLYYWWMERSLAAFVASAPTERRPSLTVLPF